MLTLTDGIFAPNGLTVIANDYGYANPSLEIEYAFSPPVDISDIRIFAGHDGDGSRGWINAKIEIDKGSGYQTLIDNLKTGDYGQLVPGQSMVSVVRLYDDAGGYIAGHVEKVKFGFYCVANPFEGTPQFRPPGSNAIVGTILKEIDIFGTSPSGVTDWINY